ncbi:hypothetical protein Cni_G23937 [Canna indica]|uniref:Uncharacterized protein n=1 Tax=Canna indica TaxID=4628 RepID=A0AAQ3QJN0_9LILI|nr:hypothetical protein Cni_G23937 [Canna indica]
MNGSEITQSEEDTKWCIIACYNHVAAIRWQITLKWWCKAKTKWIVEGDCNSAYFHRIASMRMRKNNINCLKLTNGSLVLSDANILSAFVNHYKELWDSDNASISNPTSLMPYSTILNSDRERLIAPFSDTEVWNVVRSMPNDFNFILDLIKAKLGSWHSTFLSQARRVVLINSVLNSISIHSVSVNCFLRPPHLLGNIFGNLGLLLKSAPYVGNCSTRDSPPEPASWPLVLAQPTLVPFVPSKPKPAAYPPGLVTRIIAFSENYYGQILPEGNISSTSQSSSWIPPAQDLLKINCDGSYLDFAGGISMIVRNSEGVCLIAKSSYIEGNSPLVIEALAVREALKLVITNNLSNFVIQTDSKTLIHNVSDLGFSFSDGSRRAFKKDFSEDEEKLIARMFNLVGERWSLIAGRIPGRTAEEIEKYWTSRYSSSE